MTTQRIVWLNGVFLPENEALISPFDHGVTTGDGCFETLVSYRLTPFAFTRHYNRLVASAKGLGITDIPSKEALFKASKTLIQENRLVDPIRVRITITGGLAGLGSDRANVPCTALICVTQAPDLGETCKVQCVPYTRNEKSAVVGLKTTSYAENVVALIEAHDKGASEAIFANTQGHVCEGTGSNIFWVDKGTVYTPPLASGALNGVTRGLAIELCKKLHIPVVEIDAPMSVLDEVQEAFLTSTTREVQPIIGLNGRRLLPGATTLRLRKAYKDMVDDDLDP